jgi:hypothetical protein
VIKKGRSACRRTDYDVGYGRPPKSGQIKPGEVRNRWGKNGKPEAIEDLFSKVAAELIPAHINRKTLSMSQEEAAYRKMFQEALRGNPAALKLALEQLSKRIAAGPPPPTAEELAQQESEQAERERLSARLVRLLEEKAARKRKSGARSGPYGADGEPPRSDHAE